MAVLQIMSDQDRKDVEKWVIREFLPNTNVSTPLTDEQTGEAISQLVDIVGFPKLHRRYIDPPIPNQTYGLVTFIPARDARPNDKGYYGYIKMRGTFNTIHDCKTQSDSIIRYTDSTNHIHVCRVGVPVPLVTAGFSEEVDKIDIKETVEKDVSANVRNREREDRKEIEDIQDRAEMLKKDVAEPDPKNAYMAKRTKLAVLRWSVQEHRKKEEEIRDLRDRCVRELIVESQEHPEWEESYYDTYMEARRKANIPEDQDLNDFMAYIKLPIVDPTEKFDCNREDSSES